MPSHRLFKRLAEKVLVGEISLSDRNDPLGSLADTPARSRSCCTGLARLGQGDWSAGPERFARAPLSYPRRNAQEQPVPGALWARRVNLGHRGNLSLTVADDACLVARGGRLRFGVDPDRITIVARHTSVLRRRGRARRLYRR